MFDQFKSWLSSTVHSRALIGRRLVINFPTSLDKRVGVIELPRGGSHFFVIKPSEGEGEKTARLILVSGAEEALLGVFATEELAASALGSIRRSFTRPLRRAVKWLIVAGLWALMVEWATTPTMVPRQPPIGSPIGADITLSESTRQLQMAQQAQAAQAARAAGATPEAIGLTEAAPSPGGASSETAAALRLLQGK